MIEVANTSLRKDRDQKGAIYARHGIREYWIVDVNGRCIVRFTDLRRKTYHSIVQFDDGTIAPSAYPEIEIDIEELFRSIDDVAG